MRSMKAVSLRISGGNGPEQVPDSLLVLHVDIEVANQDDASRRRGCSPCLG